MEVVSLLFEVMSGFSLGVQELLAHVEVIPAMLRRASSEYVTKGALSSVGFKLLTMNNVHRGLFPLSVCDLNIT